LGNKIFDGFAKNRQKGFLPVSMEGGIRSWWR